MKKNFLTVIKPHYLMWGLIFSSFLMNAMDPELSEAPKSSNNQTFQLSEKAKEILRFQPTSFVTFYDYWETDQEYPSQEIKQSVRLLRKALWAEWQVELFDSLVKNEPVMEVLLEVTKDPVQKNLWVVALMHYAKLTSQERVLKFFNERNIEPQDHTDLLTKKFSKD